MKIECVIVCVNYADFLKVSLPENKKVLDRIVVVTSLEDHDTAAVCKSNNVECIQTSAFYKGNTFSKFRGINEGLRHLSKKDWILFMDADIVLDPLSRRVFDNVVFHRDKIYGCDRVSCVGYDAWLKKSPLVIGNWLLTTADMEMGARICQYYGQQGENGRYAGWKPLGFFQLVHHSTLEDYPEDCTGYDHCDIVFANRYHRNNRELIPEIMAIHLESVGAEWGSNWKGRTTSQFTSIKSMNIFKRWYHKILRFKRLIQKYSKYI